MFKSVFTKYISAFMLIILLSFVMLTVVLCSTVDNYARSERNASLVKIANTVQEYMYTKDSIDKNSINLDDLPAFVADNQVALNSLIYALDEYTEDISILIADENGTALLIGDTDEKTQIKLDRIPAKIIEKIKNDGSFSGKEKIGDNKEYELLIYALPIKNAHNEFAGALFVYTALHTLPGLNEIMVKTIVMSCMWILLATMVAVYFISERITSPLKYMSRAAKSFANGHFDARVPVTGKDEISELATAFNSMASSLSSSEELRRSFLANVSHDLRTPMTTISGFIDGIIDGTIPEDKHEYYLNIIRVEVRRLSRLVSSLLDITRIQAGERKFTKSAFDICEMARVIIIGFEQKLEEKKLDVEFICDNDKMFVWADRDAIYQILYNICDNGVKFSREGAKYRISIIEKNKKVVVGVYNEGQGIEESELPFVFERFYKSDKSRGLDKTGVGLGMYIAKTIIDAHEETISVRSEYGKYCEFNFTLPYVSESEIKENM